MRRVTVCILILWLTTLIGFTLTAESVNVTYLGHSCFTIQAEDGPIIMIDPYASYVPYPALPHPQTSC